MSSGTLGPRAFIRSKRISQAVSISWPVKKKRMSPGGSERWICMTVIRDEEMHRGNLIQVPWYTRLRRDKFDQG